MSAINKSITLKQQFRNFSTKTTKSKNQVESTSGNFLHLLCVRLNYCCSSIQNNTSIFTCHTIIFLLSCGQVFFKFIDKIYNKLYSLFSQSLARIANVVQATVINIASNRVLSVSVKYYLLYVPDMKNRRFSILLLNLLPSKHFKRMAFFYIKRFDIYAQLHHLSYSFKERSNFKKLLSSSTHVFTIPSTIIAAITSLVFIPLDTYRRIRKVQASKSSKKNM